MKRTKNTYLPYVKNTENKKEIQLLKRKNSIVKTTKKKSKIKRNNIMNRTRNKYKRKRNNTKL